MSPPSKIIVGLSGGVDSAVAALQLLEQGHEVEALFMKNWEEDDRDGHCAAAQDLADAQRVCQTLGIPLHTVNFASEYWERVFRTFLDEHAAGITPNPDILCNREIKFASFLEHARDLGADQIATGHYARLRATPAGAQLLRGLDPGKDQSYFLYALAQAQLRPTRFPIGGLEKSRVRNLARRAGLENHARKDSTGICFIGERPFREFLQRYLPPQPGEIVSVEGDIVGEHQGVIYYTLGQRKGLGIGGRQDTAGQPWYVVDKDLTNHRLIVAQGHDHPRLYSSGLKIRQLHWITGQPPSQSLACSVKIRYRQTDQPGTLHARDNGWQVTFERPQRAVTPGQSAVFYQGEICLGGGVITARIS